MRTDIKFKNYNGDYALLEKELEKKLSKLDKYFPKDPKANIMISEIRGLVTTEITVTVDSTFLRVEVSDRDVRNAADKAIEKLEAQIKKNKEKLKRKLTDSIRYDESEEDVEQEDLKIVKSKKFAIKPMSAEEAALQMELLGHMFFVFLNADDEAVNVIYKRKDGQYGLIEPEF
ncbi:HPF/RaiA family ribosome-associated protein [Anaerofustis stercorihominis]|uniref:Ribosome hibernation promoting factor n=1 Tax=Anaerofustis stercorihominis DSM 17244 TaxID=445971 RepID=B1C667_9FIRM|nr:sigma 54 modulation/S30EA ribosomal C-terminal domain-containing protein [Anaerofustis stercorihominis]EDS73352.1 ribosomal subunit interface protein [Anaerofustis stercorihominis DSM 17244]MCQ4794804.1 HPF/RaiA family ribosome-associated protein [Anaerofustis stercorihominis]MCR2033012.1 HPF/RaiA family ribosome-associated protein [Anaerofustis stercorihominis]